MKIQIGKSYGGLNGLYDQITAIKWVKQNIQSYGGNADQITIFGMKLISFD